MTRLMDSVYTSMSMEHATKDNGRMIYSMDKVKKLGLMAQFTMEIINRERNTDMVLTVGTMALGMRVNGLKTRSRGLECTHG